MKGQKAILSIKDIDALLVWYSAHRRELPWRANPNPYWVWLAEVMSQQTTMTALIPYFRRFLEKFPSLESLARASESDVMSAWAGLGYYSRARNLHRAAGILHREFKGRFPVTHDEWLALPGIGPYSAAAIASQCFGERVPVWDGNVLRVCARLSADADARESAFRSAWLVRLKELMSGRSAADFNQALMELGALICSPKSPSCGKCPVSSACRAFAAGRPESYPAAKTRPPGVELACRVSIHLRKRENKLEARLVERERGHWFAGLWDFPSELGGSGAPKVPFGSEHAPRGREIGQVSHQITHHKIRLGIHVLIDRGSPGPEKGAHEFWAPLNRLIENDAGVPLATTARKALRVLFREAARGGAGGQGVRAEALALDSIRALL